MNSSRVHQVPSFRQTLVVAAACAFLNLGSSAIAAEPGDANLLKLPEIGAHWVTVLSPTIIELTWVAAQPTDPAVPGQGDFFSGVKLADLTAPQRLEVTVGQEPAAVAAIGFKRRVLYAPLKRHDLRLGSHLYLRLTTPIRAGQTVEVVNPDGMLWKAGWRFHTIADLSAPNPAIHINQVGYLPGESKKAMVGYYLGSLGELELAPSSEFTVVTADSRHEVFRGRLVPRPDRGFTFSCYQNVMEADFSGLRTPGEYRLMIPGIGMSLPFVVEDGVAAALARSYALGLYHQRCGTDNSLPFTRFVHGPCHTAPAEIPVMTASNLNKFLAEDSADFGRNPRHTARQLKDLDSCLYPFVNRGKIDVSGGHHDAGDYSKYTINSAALIHHLVFAVDAFPGVAGLDNLGIPESGDGISDVLQEAKWEADFLAKMQDADGGFYFLVYPRDRRYENNVLPDHGDHQVVWPKNTAATAAAVAALAQCASSPAFKRHFPTAAASYLIKAQAGWNFLTNALTRFGHDGAYQKMTHYGNEFMHDDELAWAATELYLATGDPAFHHELLASFDPASPATRRWTWWRMCESYGCAIRSYAFAFRTGRIPQARLDPIFLRHCEDEIIKCGLEQSQRARESAYGTSFPSESKRTRNAGWYFSSGQAFDLAVASLLDYPVMNDPRGRFQEAILSNLNYEAGNNPVNECYVTGLGWNRPRELVSQYAQNARQSLPPSGLIFGSLAVGFSWLEPYKRELGEWTFPSDGDHDAPYPMYDRWGDTFNLMTESVIVDQARALAVAAFLMARSPLKDQPWKSCTAHIVFKRREPRGTGERSGAVTPTCAAGVETPALDLARARIVWDVQNQEPSFGSTIILPPSDLRSRWVEAEIQMPDGRRAFAVTNLTWESAAGGLSPANARPSGSAQWSGYPPPIR